VKEPDAADGASVPRNVGLCATGGVAAIDARSVRRLLTSRESVPHRSLSMKVTKNLGMLLLAIWLIVTGLIPLLNLSFSGLGTLMAIVAIAAGASILVGR
jgi:uncharacterized membrane protein